MLIVVRGDIEAGAPMVVALGAVAVMVIPIAAPGDLVPLPWLGAALAAATVAAFRSGSAPAIRVVLASRVGWATACGDHGSRLRSS